MSEITCQRPYALQQLLDRLKIFFANQPLEPVSAGQLSQQLFTTLEHSVGTISSDRGKRVSACRHFSAAIHNLATGPTAIRPFSDLLVALEPELTWRHRRPAKNLLGNEKDTIANAILVGPNGLEQRDDMQIGMTLMAPNMLFTDHRHPPAEIYAVLSKGQWRQNDKPWHEPTAGGFVYNAPNILHAFKSADTPLLAIWCLAQIR